MCDETSRAMADASLTDPPQPWLDAIELIRKEVKSDRSHPANNKFTVVIKEYEVTLSLKKKFGEETFSLHYKHGAAGKWVRLAET